MHDVRAVGVIGAGIFRKRRGVNSKAAQHIGEPCGETAAGFDFHQRFAGLYQQSPVVPLTQVGIFFSKAYVGIECDAQAAVFAAVKCHTVVAQGHGGL